MDDEKGQGGRGSFLCLFEGGEVKRCRRWKLMCRGDTTPPVSCHKRGLTPWAVGPSRRVRARFDSQRSLSFLSSKAHAFEPVYMWECLCMYKVHVYAQYV